MGIFRHPRRKISYRSSRARRRTLPRVRVTLERPRVGSRSDSPPRIAQTKARSLQQKFPLAPHSKGNSGFALRRVPLGYRISLESDRRRALGPTTPVRFYQKDTRFHLLIYGLREQNLDWDKRFLRVFDGQAINQ